MVGIIAKVDLIANSESHDYRPPYSIPEWHANDLMEDKGSVNRTVDLVSRGSRSSSPEDADP